MHEQQRASAPHAFSIDMLTRDFGDAFMDALATLSMPSRTGGEFLLIDAATAHTLLDVAETTRDVVKARKDIQLARETLHSMKRYLGVLDEMDASLRAVIEMSRDRLEHRLASMERRFAAV